jgi:hypothetical protein
LREGWHDTNGDDKREFKKWERWKWRKIESKPREKKKWKRLLSESLKKLMQIYTTLE